MALNSPTTDLYACAVLPLAQDNIPVEVDTLVGVHIPVVEAGNLEGVDSLAVVYILVLLNMPVAEGNLEGVDSLAVDTLEEASNLVVEHTPAVDTLEVAFAVQPYLSVLVHVDQDLFQAFLLVFVQVTVLLLVAVQVVVLLLVVWMVVPGCPYVSPPTCYRHICLKVLAYGDITYRR